MIYALLLGVGNRVTYYMWPRLHQFLANPMKVWELLYLHAKMVEEHSDLFEYKQFFERMDNPNTPVMRLPYWS